jgi:hypothetical protein
LPDSRSRSPGGATSPRAGADRQPRVPDRGDQPEAPRGTRRPPLHLAFDERTGDRLGARLHDRRRDRPDRKVRLAREARRLHRSLSPRQLVRRQRSPRPADQARSHLPPLGPARGDAARAEAPGLRGALSAQHAPARQAAAGQRSPRSTSPVGSPTRSGTCFLATRSSLQEAPLFVWRPDRPFGLAPESEASDFA